MPASSSPRIDVRFHRPGTGFPRALARRLVVRGVEVVFDAAGQAIQTTGEAEGSCRLTAPDRFLHTCVSVLLQAALSLFWLSSVYAAGSDRVEFNDASTSSTISQDTWRRGVVSYAQSVNEFVERGMRDGWDSAGEEPSPPDLDHLAELVVEAIRDANASGETGSLRDRWPPAYEPLIPILKEKALKIPSLAVLPDSSIVVRLEDSFGRGGTMRISGDQALPTRGVSFFGRSPDRRYFSILKEDGVSILEGWEGPEVAFCPWPNGLEGVPEGLKVEPKSGGMWPEVFVPYPDGKRVLIGGQAGVYVLTPRGATRLLPTNEEILEDWERTQKQNPGESISFYLETPHGSISKDGKLTVVGHRSSSHLVFDENLALVEQIGPLSQYPHHAAFFGNDGIIALNSCWSYSGSTLAVARELLPLAAPKMATWDDDRLMKLHSGSRIFASTSRNDEFIFGDADGYVRAVDANGAFRWQLFIGSTVGAMDVSEDGKQLVVSTNAGFVSIIELDAGYREPHQIGTGNHVERRRWIFWKGESKALIW